MVPNHHTGNYNKLTARYCGDTPVGRPLNGVLEMMLLLEDIILVRTSLSFCVSANFTTSGDEQPYEEINSSKTSNKTVEPQLQ